MANFGKKVGSLKNLKKALAPKATGNMIYIPASGDELVVRFLEENDQWWEYAEVWSQELGASYPNPDDSTAPGFISSSNEQTRISRKYMANIVAEGDDGPRIGILKMPKSLVDQLVARIEKYGTVRDRDYTIYRTGEGKETRYHADPEAPSKSVHRVKDVELFDIGEALQNQYDAVWGSVVDEDDDEEPFLPIAEEVQVPVKRPLRRAAAKVVEPEPEEDDFYDASELKAMSVGQLRVLADDNNVTHAGLKKADLVAALLAA